MTNGINSKSVLLLPQCVFHPIFLHSPQPVMAAAGFFLLKGSFSFPLSPKAQNRWFDSWGFPSITEGSLQYKSPEGNCCCNMEKKYTNWIKLNWIFLCFFLHKNGPAQEDDVHEHGCSTNAKKPQNKVNRDTELTTAITQPFNTSPKQPPSPLLRGNTKLCTVGQIHNWSY